MSHIGCLCGNDVRENDFDNVWHFVAYSLMDDLADSQAFFGLEYRPNENSDVWHCKECDRLILFDDGGIRVTRYMRRTSKSLLPARFDAQQGVLYNEERFFDEVDEYFTKKSDCGEAPDYEFFDEEYAHGNPLLTPRIVREEVFDNAERGFRHWYRAALSERSLAIFNRDDASYSSPLEAWVLNDEDMATLICSE